MQKIVLREKKHYDIEIDDRVVKVKVLGDTEKLEIVDKYSELETYTKKIEKGMEGLKKGQSVKEYIAFSKNLYSEITEKQRDLLSYMLNEEDIIYLINEYNDVEIIDRLIMSLILEVQKINMEKRKEFIKKIEKVNK